MPGIPSQMIATIKELYAFRGFSDSEMAKLAAAAELVELPAEGQLVVPAGVEAPFYTVISGRITLVEDRGGGILHKDPFPYKAGQFFGADYILYEKMRRLIVTAQTPARLLRISAMRLKDLLLTIPAFKEGLLYAAQMQKWLHSKPFDWIGEDELVYLITRKHPIFLLLQWVAPVMGILGAFLLFGLSAVTTLSSVKLVLQWVSFLGFGLAALWMIWRYIDWGNDYYVVTDQRIAWIEQVLGIYESRREAFLSSIRNKRVSTANWFERRFGYGDLITTVFAGQIVFKNIPDPEEVSRLIDLLLRLADFRSKKQNVQEVQKMILEKIQDVDRVLREEMPPLPPPVLPKPKVMRLALPTWKDIQAYFRLETRFQQGEVITYRTHHIYLLAKLIVPFLIQLGTVVGAALLIRGKLQDQAMYPTIPTTILLALLLSLGALLLSLYHFADWRNDIYQIAPDRVLDKSHKPFQEEQIVQAFINDILSMEIERDNPIEVLFNIGTVIINTGTEQKLTFDNIPNPTRAMQDIYNRLFKLKKEQELAELRKQTDQAALLLATYHLYEQRQRGKSQDSGNNFSNLDKR